MYVNFSSFGIRKSQEIYFKDLFVLLSPRIISTTFKVNLLKFPDKFAVLPRFENNHQNNRHQTLANKCFIWEETRKLRQVELDDLPLPKFETLVSGVPYNAFIHIYSCNNTYNPIYRHNGFSFPPRN